MVRRGRKLLAAMVLLLPVLGAAQQDNVNLGWNPQKNHDGLIPYGAVLNSPEVYDDHTVTFRVQAPAAERVELAGSIRTAMEAGSPVAFAKGEDNIWSLTVGPLPTDIYTYEFVIDGVAVTDPGNTYAAVMASPPISQVVIHGDGPAWYDAKDVPHGTVTRHIYHSPVTDGAREMYVYTPPGYDPAREYPVLYLVGGSSGIASNWLYEGRVNFIMDNLLAEGRAEPMLIAMPNNQMLHRNHPSHADLTFDLFERELREAVIPLVDREYATRADAKGRALSGFSMGGRHAMFIGLRSPDLFASLGILSAGDENSEDLLAGFLQDPAANEQFNLLFVGQGGAEAVQPFFHARVAGLIEALTAHEIDHDYYVGGSMGHDWSTWRELLHSRFLPALWRQ